MSVPPRSSRSAKPLCPTQNPHRSTLVPIMPEFSVRTPSFNPQRDHAAHIQNPKKG